MNVNMLFYAGLRRWHYVTYSGGYFPFRPFRNARGFTFTSFNKNANSKDFALGLSYWTTSEAK